MHWYLKQFNFCLHPCFPQQPFHRVQYSLIKTFVMMIGEFEFDTIFHEQTYINYNEDPNTEDYFLTATYYEGVTYTVFTIFLVIMSILIMNLLVSMGDEP